MLGADGRGSGTDGQLRPLRVGVAAFGMSARTFHIPLIGETPGLRLHAVASSRPDAVRAAHSDLLVHPDAGSLIADPAIDIVVIPTPNRSHAPLAEAALRAGKHVVVDKPVTLDAPTAARLFEIARDGGRTLAVFHNRRWDGDFLTLQAVVASGALGRIVQFESHFDRFRPVVVDRWREDPEAGGGVWYDLGPHLVDQVLLLFGMPERVVADLGILRDHARAVDYASVSLRYRRLRAVLHATTLAAKPGPRFVVHGTAGTFTIDGLDPQEDALKAGARPGHALADGRPWGSGAPDGALTTASGTAWVTRQAGDYGAFYANLRDAVSGVAPLHVSAAETLDVMRIIDAGFLSDKLLAAVTT